MNRRAQIAMSDQEVADFLEQERTVICTTNGRDGFPHAMPLWFVMREGELWAWTFAKSQKTRNLERDARATLVVEAGDVYEQLRGVMIKSEVILHRDLEAVSALGMEILPRYSDAEGVGAEQFSEAVHAQATKRVAMQFVERERATWDHRKLEGLY